ncbi:MAG: SPOR domain-containing protein [Pseudomonadota bacterium]
MPSFVMTQSWLRILVAMGLVLIVATALLLGAVLKELYDRSLATGQSESLLAEPAPTPSPAGPETAASSAGPTTSGSGAGADGSEPAASTPQDVAQQPQPATGAAAPSAASETAAGSDGAAAETAAAGSGGPPQAAPAVAAGESPPAEVVSAGGNDGPSMQTTQEQPAPENGAPAAATAGGEAEVEQAIAVESDLTLDPNQYQVQAAAFLDPANAKKFVGQLAELELEAVTTVVEIRDKSWSIVTLGPYRRADTAAEVARTLARAFGIQPIVRPVTEVGS